VGSLDPRASDPALDVVPAPTLERVVILAATPRSGSTFLAGVLSRADVGRPVECLNPEVVEQFRARWGVPRPTLHERVRGLRRRLRGDRGRPGSLRLTRRSLRAYLDLLARHRTGPNGVFSVRVLDRHLGTLLDAGLDFDLWGPPPTFVYLSRRDRVAQAVSWHRATQDGAWSSYASPSGRGEARYDEAAIARRLADVEAGCRRWERYFATRSVAPIRVVYEDLDADHEAITARLLADLGLPGRAVQPPGVQRQRDHVNAEWVARFSAARGDGS
jgi:trehalose 2-sulfotransferase